MPVELPSVPYKQPVTERTLFLSSTWISWFRHLYLKIMELDGLDEGPNL